LSTQSYAFKSCAFKNNFSHDIWIAGDFAVLLKAGMTVKQAIVYNLLSAMMAYIGMLIGTAVGQYANNITLWIFAITAGMFLYVALVDMVRCFRWLLCCTELANRIQPSKMEDIFGSGWKLQCIFKEYGQF
jgi:hypothetical protein